VADQVRDPGPQAVRGLVIGFVGVIALLGIDVRGDAPEFLGASAVLLSALGYAAAALLYRRWQSWLGFAVPGGRFRASLPGSAFRQVLDSATAR
jgi:drug/metabolite transporter (DMT)-like permease